MFLIEVTLFVLLALFSNIGFANSNKTIDQKLFLGDCELPRDPIAGNGVSDLWLISCIDGSIGSEAVIFLGSPEKNFLWHHGDIYYGLHLLPYLSLHLKGSAFQQRVMNPDGDVQEYFYSDRDYAYLQIGNPVLNKYNFKVGELPLPFGVKFSKVMDSYRKNIDQSFWDSPRHSASLKYDTLTNFFWEIGVATDYYYEKIQDDSQETEGVITPEVEKSIQQAIEAMSLRTGYDIPALGGSRLLTSFYASKNGERRGGFGFVTVSAKGDITQFDWIRRFRSPNLRKFPFEQVVRFGYQSTWRSSSRWIVQFDDVRNKYRKGILGNDTQISKNIILRIATSLERNLEERFYRDQWQVLTGIEVQL